MEAIELRKKTDELEKHIKTLVEQFIQDVGECNIDIKTDFQFVQKMGGKSQLVNTGVKVYVTV